MSDDQSPATDPLIPILEANPTLVAILLFAIPAAIGLIFARFPRVSEREVLENPRSRARVIAQYRTPAAPAYFDAIARVSRFAERFYGEKVLSWRSFGRSLQLAFIYPILFLLFGWALFDVTEVGGFQVIGTGVGFVARLAWTALLLASWAVCFMIVSNLDAIGDAAVALLDRMMPASVQRTRFLAKIGRWIFQILVQFSAFTGAGVGAVAELCPKVGDSRHQAAA